MGIYEQLFSHQRQFSSAELSILAPRFLLNLGVSSRAVNHRKAGKAGRRTGRCSMFTLSPKKSPSARMKIKTVGVYWALGKRERAGCVEMSSYISSSAFSRFALAFACSLGSCTRKVRRKRKKISCDRIMLLETKSKNFSLTGSAEVRVETALTVLHEQILKCFYSIHICNLYLLQVSVFWLFLVSQPCWHWCCPTMNYPIEALSLTRSQLEEPRGPNTL